MVVVGPTSPRLAAAYAMLLTEALLAKRLTAATLQQQQKV